MAAFVTKQLEKILARKELKWKKHEPLRKEVEKALNQVKNADKNRDENDAYKILPKNRIPNDIPILNSDKTETPLNVLDGVTPESSQPIPPELYLVALLQSCRSGIPQVQTLALDSIQKLMIFGHISGEESPSGLKRAELVISFVCESFKGTGSDEQVSLQLLKVLLTAVQSSNFAVHGQTLLLAIKTAYNIALASKSAVNQATARATLTQTVNFLFSRMEAEAITKNFKPVNILEVGSKDQEEQIDNGYDSEEDPDKVELPESEDSESLKFANKIYQEMIKKVLDKVDPPPKFPDKNGFQSDLQKDCFIVLRSLCKLSQKSIDGADPSSGPNSMVDPKSHELRSKVLSLQLIKSALQQAGPVFKTHLAFLRAVQEFLCIAMSRNGLSPVQEVFELSISIILHLLNDFRTHLKPQTGAFFGEIFLALLEAQGTAPIQRLLVVQAMTRVCGDAQLVCDLYVNFDCGMKSVNIFEKLINVLVKISNDHNIQTKAIRAHALDCIINMLKCLVQWSRELYIPSKTDSQADFSKEENITSIKTAEPGNPIYEDSSSVYSGADIEQLKETKVILEKGIALFNKKPKRGIMLLMESNMITKTPEAVAEFLHDETRLDAATVGDYLGDTANREVMYIYVDKVDMAGLDFVGALRAFLEAFQLPGEAQKVDRLMEKFAARYIECNPHTSVFASADAAYVLAFSIIMLATDLHSSQIKKKMTCEDYIKMNRGVNEQRDLPREYLENIYEQVALKPLQLRGGRSAKAITTGNSDKFGMSNKEKQNAAKIQRTQMEQSARAALEEAVNKDTLHQWMSAKDVTLSRPMFKAIWQPCLVALSRCIQEESQIVPPRACLDGLQCAIRLAGMFDLTVARQSYIQALTRFSLLQPESLGTANETITPKNIEAIKAMLAVAITCGNYLGESWLVILRCVSKLELLQLVGQKVPNIELKPKRSKNKKNADIPQNNLSETNHQSIIKAVDKIFARSCGLEGDAVVSFATALCRVSDEELNGTNPDDPRMFSLQKLVEISYYNLGRVRFQWAKLWQVIGEHFQKAGCSKNTKVASYALDSLRQISLKFLERGELKNFRFQKEFLRPFEVVIRGGRQLQVRDFVIRCIQQFVEARCNALRSGWRNILAILAASSNEPPLANIAFPVVVRSSSELLNTDIKYHSLGPSWNDLVKCLGDFAVRSSIHSMEALKIMREASDIVANKELSHEIFEKDNISVDEKLPDLPAEDRIWARAWFPLLFELTAVITRAGLDVRTRALSVLFEIIKYHGQSFRQSWWEDLFQIIFKTLEGDPENNYELTHGELSDTTHAKNSVKLWKETTCQHCLFGLTEIIVQFNLNGKLLKTALDRYRWAAGLGSDSLAAGSTQCIQVLLTSMANLDESEEYSLALCAEDLRVIIENSPHCLLELVQAITNSLLDEQMKNIEDYQDEIISPTKSISEQDLPSNVGLSSLTLKTVLSLIRTMLECSRAGVQAQQNYGSGDGRSDPSINLGGNGEYLPPHPEILLKLETTAVMQGLRCLYKLYQYYYTDDERVLQAVVDAEALAMRRMSTEPGKWKHVGCFVIASVLKIKDADKFKHRIKKLHPHFCKLVAHQLSSEVNSHMRNHMKTYFERLGTLAGLDD